MPAHAADCRNPDQDRYGEAIAAGPACSHARKCPISHGPCPGECIYADVMESQQLGVVIFDLGRSSLLFINRFARELFQRLEQPPDCATLRELLLAPGPEGESDQAARSLKVGARLLGFTVYRAHSFAWVYIRDITNKARLESIAEAVETMNNIGYVFSAVRHELGNPINSVKAALSVLRANFEAYPPHTVAEYLERIAMEVGRVENLLRSLKSFSLYERPEVEALDMTSFVEQFLKLVSDEARARGLTLEAALTGDCRAACDPRALQQVMLNIFANASDAVRGLASAELKVSLTRGDGLVTLRMSDNGHGMPEDELGNLFKPFYTTKETGTGLGLVISRKMLAKMGGTIAVESRQGLGTTVTIALPEWPACATPP